MQTENVKNVESLVTFIWNDILVYRELKRKHNIVKLATTKKATLPN